MFEEKDIDKSKGLSFFVDGVDFYRGLYSTGSHIASVDGREIYLSGILCRSSSLSLKETARRQIRETLYYENLKITKRRNNYEGIFKTSSKEAVKIGQ